MNGATFDSSGLYANDPFAKTLIDKWRLNPIKLGLIILVIEVSTDLVPGYFLDVLSGTRGEIIGFFHGWPQPFFGFIIVPITWGYYLWMATSPRKLLEELKAAKVVDIDDASFDTQIKRYVENVYSHWTWTVASVVVVVIAANAVEAKHAFSHLWIYASQWYYWPKMVQTYFGWYVVCMIVARELSTIIVLRDLFKKHKVNLYPLHPDNCGGLSALNAYSIKFTYFIGIAGLGVSLIAYESIQIGDFQANYLIHSAICAYIVLAIYTFFAPLGTAHNAMRETKEQWLMDISRQFQVTYESTTRVLNSPGKKLKSNIEKIEQLQEIYKVTEEFPVWPFDTRTLQRFGATIFTSLSPVVVSLIMKILRIG